MSDHKENSNNSLEESFNNFAGSISSQFDKIMDQRFCIGITGLSQSGKTTFITSLISQLLHHDAACLPGFSPTQSERLLSVKIHPLKDKDLAPFPYDEAYAGITSANPSWPSSTENMYGCLLELKLARASGKLNPFSREHFSLHLEVRDYPGEWLLDLPLLDMGYSRWCAQCNAQYTQQPRLELLGKLLPELQQIDPLAEVDESRLVALVIRFSNFLKDCKYNGKSLSLIQPGRFLIPGRVEDTSVLCFVPLLNCGNYTEGQLSAAGENSYYKVCERRYQRYIQELVTPFYKTFFSRIDRQLILVDVVNALNAGPEYVNDMRQALTNIIDSFSYGSQNRLFQLFSPKIDKVVFAATKIDQVLSEDHEAVRQLLSVIVKQAYKNAQHEGVQPFCEATAAVRSSQERQQEGRRCVVGAGTNGKNIGYIHPTIPSRIPEGEEWRPFLDWKIPTLNPPKGISAENADPFPHIRMDSILNALIGDKCQ